jgi:hypothetical protein
MDNENVHVVVNLLDYVPCEEGRRTEGWYMKQATYDETIECVNHNIPGQTRREYYEANKEKITKYQKEYQKEYRKTYIRKIKSLV